MSVYVVEGGNPLSGELRIQGSKNAALPLMAATIINRGCTILHNCPEISDVYSMIDILREVGCKVEFADNTLYVDGANVSKTDITGGESGKVRGSFLIAGAMLARLGEIKISYPGGCHIGARPVNYHLEAFYRMHINISLNEEGIECCCERPEGASINLPFPSVGATENILLAGARARGVTTIHNAAKEPEVIELCELLQQFGVKVVGAGTSTISIIGVDEEICVDISHNINSDRIVAATYAYSVAATGGKAVIIVDGSNRWSEIMKPLVMMGNDVNIGNDNIIVKGIRIYNSISYIKTEPYPGFPTDMQSQLMVLLARANGDSVIEEGIFENRFHIADELTKMGADIRIENNHAYIRGVNRLKGATLVSKDLRGGAALIIAGLTGVGVTRVVDPGYIARGYEDISRDIRLLGGNIHYEQISE